MRLSLVLLAAVIALCSQAPAHAKDDTARLQRTVRCPEASRAALKVAIRRLLGRQMPPPSGLRSEDRSLSARVLTSKMRLTVQVSLEPATRVLELSASYRPEFETEDAAQEAMREIYGLLRKRVPDLPEWQAMEEESVGHRKPTGRWLPGPQEADDELTWTGRVIGLLVLIAAIALFAKLMNGRDRTREEPPESDEAK